MPVEYTASLTQKAVILSHCALLNSSVVTVFAATVEKKSFENCSKEIEVV